jgi:hypothetical protein
LTQSGALPLSIAALRKDYSITLSARASSIGGAAAARRRKSPMRAAQTLTVDKHAALFEDCDIFIDTDDDSWTFVAANTRAERGSPFAVINGGAS